jgi:hypothetical protein
MFGERAQPVVRFSPPQQPQLALRWKAGGCAVKKLSKPFWRGPETTQLVPGAQYSQSLGQSFSWAGRRDAFELLQPHNALFITRALMAPICHCSGQEVSSALAINWHSRGTRTVTNNLAAQWTGLAAYFATVEGPHACLLCRFSDRKF